MLAIKPKPYACFKNKLEIPKNKELLKYFKIKIADYDKMKKIDADRKNQIVYATHSYYFEKLLFDMTKRIIIKDKVAISSFVNVFSEELMPESYLPFYVVSDEDIAKFYNLLKEGPVYIKPPSGAAGVNVRRLTLIDDDRVHYEGYKKNGYMPLEQLIQLSKDNPYEVDMLFIAQREIHHKHEMRTILIEQNGKIKPIASILKSKYKIGCNINKGAEYHVINNKENPTLEYAEYLAKKFLDHILLPNKSIFFSVIFKVYSPLSVDFVFDETRQRWVFLEADVNPSVYYVSKQDMRIWDKYISSIRNKSEQNLINILKFGAPEFYNQLIINNN